jgi:hypothetical protein
MVREENFLTLAELERRLLAGREAVFIKSWILDGETICLAADDALLLLDDLLNPVERFRGCVVYRVSELKRLARERPGVEQLRAHHTKKCREEE